MTDRKQSKTPAEDKTKTINTGRPAVRDGSGGVIPGLPPQKPVSKPPKPSTEVLRDAGLGPDPKEKSSVSYDFRGDTRAFLDSFL